MIQKLEYETERDKNGNVYGAIPSDTEIIAKVNEVIDALNQMLNKEEQKRKHTIYIFHIRDRKTMAKLFWVIA